MYSCVGIILIAVVVALTKPSTGLNSNVYVTQWNKRCRCGFRKPVVLAAHFSSQNSRHELLNDKDTSYYDSSSSKQNAIFEWVKINDGFVHPNIELSTGPDASWCIPGIFATGPIPKGETILYLPPSLMFRNNSLCNIIFNLREELTLRKKSFWWPYLSFLEEINVNIPAFWTEEEREPLSALSPINWVRPVEWYKSACCSCNNDSVPTPYLHPLNLVVSRCNIVRHNQSGLMFYLTPLYDFINHGSKEQKNTISLWNEQGRATISASEDIKAGEQLWNHYGYEDVDSLFSLYGFLPQYPRLWIFGAENNNENSRIIFQMYEEKDGTYTFDFNPFNSHPTIRMGYMRYKIQTHLTNVLSRFNNTKPLQRYQGRQHDSDGTASLRTERHMAALAYRQEYFKALEEALRYIDRNSNHRRPFFVSAFLSDLSLSPSITQH